MRKQVKNRLSLQKLTIARIQKDEMCQVNGGDCIPTDPTWYDHLESEVYCHTKDIP